MLLLESKCDANVADKDGETPLIVAVSCNELTVARELVWSLCDLKIRDNKGKTAAEMAKQHGNDVLAEYLVNQAPREQVRFASRAHGAIIQIHSSTRLFSIWL